jgi:hypothetical protein
MTKAELALYIESEEWRQRCAELRARQEEHGEFMELTDIPKIAQFLGVPEWFAVASLMEVARRQDAINTPDKGGSGVH